MKDREQHRGTVPGILPVLLLAFLLSTIAGCAKRDRSDREVPPQEASALEERKEKLSYALGMVLGNQFRERAVEVDLNLYIRGLEDGLSGGNTLLTDTEARAAVNELQSELQEKRTALAGNSSAITGIQVFFKLDPRLTRGLQMGDRWISPPIYTSIRQMGAQATVEIRAEVLDQTRNTGAKSPKWIPADPDMVTVSPEVGSQVKMTVHHAGESSLEVKSGDFSKTLIIKAMYQEEANTTHVEISQKSHDD